MHILLQLHVSIKFWYIPIWLQGTSGGRDEGQFFVKFEAGKEGRMGPRPHDLFSGNLISEFKKFEFIKRCVDPDPLHDTLSRCAHEFFLKTLTKYNADTIDKIEIFHGTQASYPYPRPT